MTIRRDMLAAASRARNLLSDSAQLVVRFLSGQNNEDGGFRGRAEASDLYYTIFGLEALMVLQAEVPWKRVAGYLQQFGDGASLDLVHLASLTRCWADIAESQNPTSPKRKRREKSGTPKRIRGTGFQPVHTARMAVLRNPSPHSGIPHVVSPPLRSGLVRSGLVRSGLVRSGLVNPRCPGGKVREGLLRNIERYKCPDGGYSNSTCPELSRRGRGGGRPASGTCYGCFLALGAYQDLNVEVQDAAAIVDCVRSLRTPDGGYSNDSTIRIGSTAATAAAVTVLHYLGEPPDMQAADWLLSRLHHAGGFVAMPDYGPAAAPDLLSTATALHGLSLMGVSTSAVRENPLVHSPGDSLRRTPDGGDAFRRTLDFIKGLRRPAGGFASGHADQVLDCEYTYYALLSLGHLSYDSKPEA